MIDTVLFDLDGTLLDTAPDLGAALNQLRSKHDMEHIPIALIRPYVGYGARAMLKFGFDIDENHPQFTQMLEDFLNFYSQCLANSTRLFPEMENVLDHLEAEKITWGIVTNKPARFTFDILKSLQLDNRAACIICGDSLPKRKPNPDQIIHACNLLKRQPANCLYIGDTSIDVTASKAAGTKSLVALYGYIKEDENPHSWNADGYIKQPMDIIGWLEKNINGE